MKLHLLPIAVCYFMATLGIVDAQPKTPKDKLPANLPPEVKSHVLLFYGDKPADRVSAAATLAGMGKRAKPALPIMKEMLNDGTYIAVEGAPYPVWGDSSWVGMEIARIMAGMGKPATDILLETALKGQMWHEGKSAQAGLASMGSPGVEILRPYMKSENRQERQVATDAIVMMGKSGVPSLIEMLKDDDEYMLQSAAEALGQIGDTRAVEPLIHLLDHPKKGPKWRTVVALGKLKDKRATMPLIAVANRKTDDAQTRFNACQSLGQIGDTAATTNLIKLLNDAVSGVRSGSAAALGQIKDKRAVEPLLDMLEDTEWNVRSSAVAALGDLGDGRAVNPLIERLQDASSSVRANAAASLGKLKARNAVEPLIVALKKAIATNQGMDKQYMGQAILSITGCPFSHDPAKLEAWWKENKDKHAED